MLRTNSPAPITSSSDTATCTTTSTLRNPKRDDPAPGVPSFNASVSEGRSVCEATLSMFGVLDDTKDWQRGKDWLRLDSDDRRRLAEDTRELLMLLAWARVRTLGALKALRSHHIWSDAVVEERFNRWARDGVHALIVRVFELPEPVVIPELESYAGCKSWISLAEQVPLAGARPVLGDAEFEKRMNEVKAHFR